MGVLLLSNLLVRGAYLIVVLLSCLFAFGVLSALVNGLNISCGCWSGEDTGGINYLTLIRIIIILIVSIIGFLIQFFGKSERAY